MIFIQMLQDLTHCRGRNDDHGPTAKMWLFIQGFLEDYIQNPYGIILRFDGGLGGTTTTAELNS